MKMEKEQANYRKNSTTHLLLGILAIILGLAVIAEVVNAVPWSMKDIIFSWQMILIVLGVIFITNRENHTAGIILITVGLFFVMPRFFDVPHYWRSLFWPVVLIIIGLVVIFQRHKRPCAKTEYENCGNDRHRHGSKRKEDRFSNEYIDDVDVFGGADRTNNSQNFKGGKMTHIFGGSKYDFRGARLAEGTQHLEVLMIFGGSKIIVPEEWDVKIEVTSIFGGFSDKRGRSIVVPDNDRRIIVRGIALFGGGEIANV